jgi:hypothetical protein
MVKNWLLAALVFSWNFGGFGASKKDFPPEKTISAGS